MRILSLSPSFSGWLSIPGLETALVPPDPLSPGQVFIFPTGVSSGTEFDLVLKEINGYPGVDKPLDINILSLGRNVPELVMKATTFKQVLDAVLQLGQRVGCLPSFMEKIATAEGRLDRLRKKAGLDRRVLPSRRLVWIDRLESPRPPAYWIPDLIEAGGGVPVGFDGDKVLSTVFTEDFIVSVDAVFFAFPGRAAADTRLLVHSSGLLVDRVLPAITVYLDGEHLCYRRTPGLYRTAELILAALYPDRVDPSELGDNSKEMIVERR